jgi:hypothetical protein
VPLKVLEEVILWVFLHKPQDPMKSGLKYIDGPSLLTRHFVQFIFAVFLARFDGFITRVAEFH